MASGTQQHAFTLANTVVWSASEGRTLITRVDLAEFSLLITSLLFEKWRATKNLGLFFILFVVSSCALALEILVPSANMHRLKILLLINK